MNESRYRITCPPLASFSRVFPSGDKVMSWAESRLATPLATAQSRAPGSL